MTIGGISQGTDTWEMAITKKLCFESLKSHCHEITFGNGYHKEFFGGH